MASRMSKKFTGFLSRSKSTTHPDAGADNSYVFDTGPADTNEAEIVRNIRLFCESGSAANSGEEEVLYLPAVVELADASPTAAAAAARQIRLFIGREWAVKPHVQYNAVMLIRILSDHPGATFTRNFDKGFVSTIKECLRMCRDESTQQILRETLDSLEYNKRSQEGVDGLIVMWRREKGSKASISNAGTNYQASRGFQNDLVYGYPSAPQRPSLGDHRHSSRHNQLPPPAELASRIEEAKNSAKILLQLIQSTPSEEVIHNELLREFSDRCSSAQKSMAGYIACDNPPPDDETMLTLIETNEQLSLAASRYQRAILNARKAMGGTPSPNAEAMQKSGYQAPAPPVGPPPSKEQSLFAAPVPRSPPKVPEPPGLGISAFSNANTNEDFQAPSGPPPRQTTLPRVLPNNTAPSSGPYSAPAQQPVQQSAFGNGNGSHSPPPPSPPTAMLARLNSRGSNPDPARFSPKPVSDPFADPVERNQNTTTMTGQPAVSNPLTTLLQHPAHRPHSNTFSVDAGPTYAPRDGITSPANDDDDEHYNASPMLSRTGTGFDEPVSPVSPSQQSPVSSSQQRWQELRAASYMGRQASATQGLTMHGAQADPSTAEIDGYSNVGRMTQPPMLRTDTQESDNASSAYSVTPSQTRT